MKTSLLVARTLRAGRRDPLRIAGAALGQGDLSGTVGCGSHRAPGTAPFEDCHESKHYEG